MQGITVRCHGCVTNAGTQEWNAIVERIGFRTPFGHPHNCVPRISLILWMRAWSKLGVQVIIYEWFSDPFKAWVAGSSPAALTILGGPSAMLGISAAGSDARQTPQRGGNGCLEQLFCLLTLLRHTELFVALTRHLLGGRPLST